MAEGHTKLSFDSILVRLKVKLSTAYVEIKTRFDSILVRLKGSGTDTCKRTARRFRFHTGSIKSVNLSGVLDDNTCFDSILVRLKVTSSSEYRCSSATFRFHTGSIKRNPNQQGGNPGQQFRFHTGSIKRTQDMLKPVVELVSFDSILVRLKVADGSTTSVGTWTFRFHTGSIKSELLSENATLYIGFDSILVRLKGYLFV